MPATEADHYLGMTVGQVQLNKKLGQGGMGMVYRGMHAGMNRQVAMKILLHQDGDQGRVMLERFMREGQAAAAVHHPNVVEVLDAGDTPQFAYLVLEYVDGSSLGRILRRKKRLDPAMVEALGISLAEGLAAIHAQGIIHRDIKPDNILLSRAGLVKIADLGLARQVNDPELNRLTVTGMVVGTPLYVSPEAISDVKSAGAPSDIYSLGATLYHLLSGDPPYDADTPYEVMRLHMEANLIPLNQRCPEAPATLCKLIDCCLQRDAAQRPTATEIAQALRGKYHLQQRQPPKVWLLMLGLVTAMVIAAGSVWLLTNQPADTGDTTVSVTLTTTEAAARGLEYQLSDSSQNSSSLSDDADWQAWTGQAITFTPPSPSDATATAHQSEHHIELSLRQLRDGVWFRWKQRLDLPTGPEQAGGGARARPRSSPANAPRPSTAGRTRCPRNDCHAKREQRSDRR